MATMYVLRVRYRREETRELWRVLLTLYRREGKKAEDLLNDALKYLASLKLKPEIY